MDRNRPYRDIIRKATKEKPQLDRKTVSKYALACEEMVARGATGDNFVQSIKELGGIEAASKKGAERRKAAKRATQATPPVPNGRAVGEVAQPDSPTLKGKVESVFLPGELRAGNVDRQDLTGWQLIGPTADRKSFTIAPVDAPPTATNHGEAVDGESEDKVSREPADAE